ncbi:MAG: PH domain-containing protein, partial [Candidatus Methanomethylophilaceae archaeon]|nr:PH domain-containing protein [Candidatus Methanomethylophilaceae archaeon]
MDDPAEDGFRTLDPVSKKAMYVGNALTMAAFAVFAAVSLHFSQGTAWFLPSAAMVVFAVVLAFYLFLSPPVFYRHYRYRMDDDCIEVRSGVVIRSHVLVPVERVHQVAVNKGPILRKFGLAQVTVTTAGGTATLEYLDEPVAEYIAANLNEKI